MTPVTRFYLRAKPIHRLLLGTTVAFAMLTAVCMSLVGLVQSPEQLATQALGSAAVRVDIPDTFPLREKDSRNTIAPVGMSVAVRTASFEVALQSMGQTRRFLVTEAPLPSSPLTGRIDRIDGTWPGQPGALCVSDSSGAPLGATVESGLLRQPLKVVCRYREPYGHEALTALAMPGTFAPSRLRADRPAINPVRLSWFSEHELSEQTRSALRARGATVEERAALLEPRPLGANQVLGAYFPVLAFPPSSASCSVVWWRHGRCGPVASSTI